MAEGKTYMFVFFIMFWTMLSLLGQYFEISLTNSDISTMLPEFARDNQYIEPTNNFITNALTWIFDKLDTLPGINHFVPLMKIMFFQYTDQIPPAISLLLDAMGIYTFYLVFSMIRGTDS